jgi:defect-in-organelle-trafficking protein DotB
MSQDDQPPSDDQPSSNSPFATSSGTDIFEYLGGFGHDEFDALLAWASERKASDISIQPWESVMAEIGGKWRRITKLPLTPPNVQNCVNAIYGANGYVEISRGHDLDPSYEIKHPSGEGKLRFRVNITGGRASGGGPGAQLTLRTLPSTPIKIEDLYIEQDIMTYFRPEQGLNLICGPTGSGKSTLLSSLIRWRCEQEDANEKVIEYSRPIEYVYDGLRFPSSFVFQTEVGSHLQPKQGEDEGSLWAYAMRNALRRKPSIIILGESRDKATIEACIMASMSGHLTVSTLHTIGVPETFRRLVMAFPANERQTIAIDLLQVINLIVTQLLIKKIGGGKQGIREYMLFDANVRKFLEDMPVDDWPAHIRKMLSTKKINGRTIIGRSMKESADELVLNGKITPDVAKYISARQNAEMDETLTEAEQLTPTPMSELSNDFIESRMKAIALKHPDMTVTEIVTIIIREAAKGDS